MPLGLFGILGIVFVVLKLCEVIAWSWWLVLLPFYGGLAFVVIAMVIFAFMSALSKQRRANMRGRF